MPSFLFPYQPIDVPVYQHPMELMGKALMYRDAKVKEGLQSIRSKYDSILSYQLTNPENQEFVRTEMKSALDRLDRLSGADLSLQENVGIANSSFDPITNDAKLLEDIGFTKHLGKVKSEIETLKKEHPELVAPQNVFPIMEAEEEYRSAKVRSGNENVRPRFVQYEPYYDFEKRHNDVLSKIKADTEVIFSDLDYIVDTPWDQNSPRKKISALTQQEREFVSEDRIRKALQAELNSDPKLMRQMGLDHNYNSKNGLYNPKELKDRTQTQLNTWRSKVAQAEAELANAKTAGLVTPEQASAVELQIKDGKQYINTLLEKVSILQSNPSAYQFNINDLAEAYFEKQIGRWAYTKEGKLELMPGQDKMLGFQLDTTRDMLQSSLRMNEEKYKFDLKESAEAKFVNVDGTPTDDIWLYRMSESLAQNGFFTTNVNDPALRVFAGDVSGKTSGPMTVQISPNMDESDPSSSIIVTSAELGSDHKKLQEVADLVRIDKIKEALKKIDPGQFKTQIDFGPDYVAPPVPGGLGIDSTVEMSTTQSFGKIVQLYKNYLNNPTNDKYASVFETNKQVFEKLGITKNTSEQEADNMFKQKQNVIGLDDKKLNNIIKFGVLASGKLNGNYEFIPDNNKTILANDKGNPMLNGWIVVSEEDAKNMFGSKTLNEYKKQGLAVAATTAVEYLTSDKKDYADRLAIKVMKPVKSNNEDLLRMTQEAISPYGQGKERAKYLERSSKFFKAYQSGVDMRTFNNQPSTNILIKSNNVKVENLHSNLKTFYSDFNSMFNGLVVTSGNDATHKEGSRHYSNKAIDIGANSSNKLAYNKFKSYILANADTIKAQYGIEDILDEGDHIHIELPA
jgi:hypothetical protein